MSLETVIVYFVTSAVTTTLAVMWARRKADRELAVARLQVEMLERVNAFLLAELERRPSEERRHAH